MGASARLCGCRFPFVCYWACLIFQIHHVFKLKIFFSSLLLPSHWRWRLLHKTMTLLRPKARWRVTWRLQRAPHRWKLSKYPTPSPWVWKRYMKPLLLGCACREAFMDLTRTWVTARNAVSLQNACVERLSIECRKTETKVITLANHKGHRQYSEPIKARSNCI